MDPMGNDKLEELSYHLCVFLLDVRKVMVGNRAQQETYSETKWFCGVLLPIPSMYGIFT